VPHTALLGTTTDFPVLLAPQLARYRVVHVFVASETPMSKSILIADDNAPSRQVVRKVVERAGFAVCSEAVDGVDAVDKASELKPDLIVLDLRLPRLNGIEAAYILRGRLPHTPIVLFTMYDVSPSVVSAAGITSLIHKSDGIAKLSASVEELLASRPHLPPPSSSPTSPSPNPK
jgi:DNA-binding NarL/FixJ family response regulator